MGVINDGNGNKCPICGTEHIEIYSCGVDSWVRCYTCPECGEFFANQNWYENSSVSLESDFKEKLRSYLFYNKTELRPFICSDEDFSKIDISSFKQIYHLSPSTVEAWYPKSFGEKIDLILLKLADLAEYDGAYIQTIAYVDKLFFCSSKRSAAVRDGSDKNIQLEYIDDFLVKNEYVNKNGHIIYQLTPKALERIYELRRSQSNNRNVFVSMAFNDGTMQTREAIRTAIVNAGYSPEFIDEIIHNKQIVPEMFRLIRECRFLILDISDPIMIVNTQQKPGQCSSISLSVLKLKLSRLNALWKTSHLLTTALLWGSQKQYIKRMLIQSFSFQATLIFGL